MATSTSSSTAAVDLEVLYGQIPTPTETPSLIEESMNEFRALLEKDTNNNNNNNNNNEEENERETTTNWRLAEEKCPNECRDEFKLIFLRCEVFRVELAVQRYIKYWNNRVEIFGLDKAFLPILDVGPNGAMKDNHEEMNCGYTRMSNPGECEDPDGRVICFVDGTQLDAVTNDPNVTVEGLVRASWYRCHVGLQSELAQRKGIVVIYKSVTKFSSLIRKSPTKSLAASIRGALPIRLAAIHIVDPPGLASIIVKVARRFLGKKLQKRIHVHNHGSFEKNLESLATFGLGRKQLPKELGGDFVFETTTPVTSLVNNG